MIRWVRTHPYTTATPFMTAALIALLKVASGLSWWSSAACVGFFVVIGFIGALTQRSR